MNSECDQYWTCWFECKSHCDYPHLSYYNLLHRENGKYLFIAHHESPVRHPCFAFFPCLVTLLLQESTELIIKICWFKCSFTEIDIAGFCWERSFIKEKFPRKPSYQIGKDNVKNRAHAKLIKTTKYWTIKII